MPPAVVSRLSRYLRELQHLVADGTQTTSSSQLGVRLGFTDAQVRKDLAHFGQFGHPGIGYRCDELIAEIRKILGTDRRWSVALMGVGNLGRALLGYRGFESQGFRIAAAFDADPAKSARRSKAIEVFGVERLGEVVAELRIELGMVAAPAAQAQAAADQLVAAGVQRHPELRPGDAVRTGGREHGGRRPGSRAGAGDVRRGEPAAGGGRREAPARGGLFAIAKCGRRLAVAVAKSRSARPQRLAALTP